MGRLNRTPPITAGPRRRAASRTERQAIALRRTLAPLMDDPDLEILDPDVDSDADPISYIEMGLPVLPTERFF